MNWNGFESKLSLEYFDIGFRDYTDIVEEFARYIYIYIVISIRYLLVSEFDIEYKPIYFLSRALYLISNGIWVCREWCLH